VKKLLTIILTFLITATIAQARIGWTKEECEHKYGRPARISPIADVLDYKPEGFKLSAEFYKGKVYAISYEPETPLSEQPVELERVRHGSVQADIE
jgi:hypothetical protein